MRRAERNQTEKVNRALMAAGIVRHRKKIALRIVAFVLAGLLLCCLVLTDIFLFPVEYLWASVLTPDIEKRLDGQMRVFYLDVGQGDCSIAELPDGQILMIDCGDGSSEGLRNILGVCVSLGVERIDHLFITHTDSDHIGGMEAVLRCFGANTVYLPEENPDDLQLAQCRALAEKYSHKICDTLPLTFIVSDDKENFWYASVLSGFLNNEKEGNDASAVLYMEYAGRKLLFPGDISSFVERELLTIFEQTGGIVFEIPAQTSFGTVLLSPDISGLDFLKAGHHGGSDSTCLEFAQYLCPEAVFFSCGVGNSYGHPAQDVVENLLQAHPSVQFYRTDELGNIMLTIERDGRYSVLSV